MKITTALSAVALVSANSAGALGDATATLAGIGLEGINGTVVVAIRGAVVISVSIDVAAPALAGRDLVKIVGTAVVTVRGAIVISIGSAFDASVGVALVDSADVSSVGAAE